MPSMLPALLAALLLCAAVAATPTSPATPTNYNCPQDCNCTLSQHSHRPQLHAKCSSIKGLTATTEEPLQSELPIHSIDLSYLHLTRVAHVLDQLPNVTSVDLSHNELHEIGHLSKRVKKLNLKYNRLTSSKLAKLPQHLQTLNLQHNDITTLPLELTHLHNLEQLELSHNAINCSCETLEVRNWLQERHVYMAHAVVCSHPAEARGKPWLQLKQSEICDKEKRGWYAQDIDENELMMGDQPMEGSGERDEEEELGKDYLPVGGKKASTSPRSSEHLVMDDVEGSGDLSVMNMPLDLAKEDTATTQHADVGLVTELEDNDEGSGSGGGILIIPDIARGTLVHDDFDADTDSKQAEDNDDKFDNQPVEEPAVVFKHQGIFEGAAEEEPQPASEEPIVAVAAHNELDSPSDVVTDGPLDSSEESQDILSAKIGKKDDSNATYYLLTVIGLIVLGLILFVAIKRCKYNSNAAARDAEAARQTELLDMDKKQLGKPLRNGNGNEHAPLIGEKTKLDEAQPINGKKAYDGQDAKDGNGQQPLLNGNGSANGKDVPTINEPAAGHGHEYYPITPRYPTPQSPRASKYAQHPQQGSPGSNGEQNNNEPDSAYLPSSPKSGRYSPVYSPETGRVKIKLTETPKPKTPMLVTRSKSNAGEIITTPYQVAAESLVAPQAATVGGGANGHVGH